MYNKEIITYIIAGIVILLVSLISIVAAIYNYNSDLFCKENYPSNIAEPSILSNNYASDTITETGYIECCRKIIINHKIEIECKIIKR